MNERDDEYNEWEEEITNTSAFFWSTLLGLFLGWVLYQPLSIFINVIIEIYNHTTMNY